MITEAIEKIEELADVSHRIKDINGLPYTDADLKYVLKPTPKPLVLSTLASLIDYLNENSSTRDNIGAQAVVHVEEHDLVRVYAHLEGDTKQRHCFAMAKYEAQPFNFGEKFDMERFLIMLQARFEDTPQRKELLAALGNVRAEKITIGKDDGITQSITRKMGAVLEDTVPIKNPVVLKPIRFFTEIDQLESPFILRLHQRDNEIPTVSLHEADGGAWKVAAKKAIAQHITGKISHLVLA